LTYTVCRGQPDTDELMREIRDAEITKSIPLVTDIRPIHVRYFRPRKNKLCNSSNCADLMTVYLAGNI